MGEIPALVADGTQEAILAHVTSVNVACGAHAGDEATIEATIRAALRHGRAVGAHPGYPDRDHFGRRILPLPLDEITRTVAEQVIYVAGIAAGCGARLTHVKPHGALYNAAAGDRALAAAIAAGVALARQAIRARRDAVPAGDDLVLVGLAGSACLDVYAAEGFRVAAEAFADRRYEPDATLRARRHPDALLTDPDEAADQALRLARDAEVVAVGGAVVAVRASTLCLHGDTPGAARIAAAVAARLRAAGVEPSSLGA
jgi:5-oxoprolinase (ATP-hydrolysing) subunit A